MHWYESSTNLKIDYFFDTIFNLKDYNRVLKSIISMEFNELVCFNNVLIQLFQ